MSTTHILAPPCNFVIFFLILLNNIITCNYYLLVFLIIIYVHNLLINKNKFCYFYNVTYNWKEVMVYITALL